MNRFVSCFLIVSLAVATSRKYLLLFRFVHVRFGCGHNVRACVVRRCQMHAPNG